MGKLTAEEFVKAMTEASENEGIGKAVSLGREAAAAFSEDAKVLANLAHHLLWSGEYEEAFETASCAATLDANCSDAHCVLADHAAVMGNAAESMKQFEKANSIEPNSRLTKLAGLNAYSVSKQNDKALQFAQALVASDPDSPSAWSGLYYTLHAVGRAEEADAMLDSAPKKVKNSGDYHLAMTRFWLRQVDLRRAEKCARKAVNAAPYSNSTWSALAQAVGYQGKLEEGREAAEKALAINRRDSVALSILEQIAEALEDHDAARDARERAAGALPFLNDTGEFDEVQRLIRDDKLALALEKARDLEPNVPEPYEESLRGTILWLLQQMNRWGEIEERLLKLGEETYDADCFLASAALTANRGDLKGSLETLELGSSKFTHNIEIRGRILMTLAALGENDRLETEIQFLKETQFGNPGGFIELTSVLLDLERTEEAVQVLEKGLEEFPDSSDLQMLMLSLTLGGLDFEAA